MINTLKIKIKIFVIRHDKNFAQKNARLIYGAGVDKANVTWG